MRRLRNLLLAVAPVVILANGCTLSGDKSKPRLSMFVGVDISGSFLNGKYFDDSIDFLAHYLYSHLNGLGGLEQPNVLFVSCLFSCELCYSCGAFHMRGERHDTGACSIF